MFRRGYIWCLIPISIALFTSCEIINPEEAIPTYVEVSDYEFDIAPDQGTAKQQISSFYVYLDFNLQGVYPYPSEVPLLIEEDGDHQLIIGAAVEMNGNASNNQEYFALNRDTFTISKNPGDVRELNPRLEYKKEVQFKFVEGFETGSELAFDVDNDDQTNLKRISDTVFEGAYAGQLEVDTMHPVMEVASLEKYTLPKTGTPIYIELHYRNSIEFDVGLLAINSGTGESVRAYRVRFRTRDDWNKVYINMVNEVRQLNADQFRVLIGTFVPPDGSQLKGTVQIDNVKLLYP